jgi:hypothetical protein
VTAAIPGARLTTIPVGHRVHSLGPDAFAAEVLAFMAELAVAAQPTFTAQAASTAQAAFPAQPAFSPAR